MVEDVTRVVDLLRVRLRVRGQDSSSGSGSGSGSGSDGSGSDGSGDVEEVLRRLHERGLRVELEVGQHVREEVGVRLG